MKNIDTMSRHAYNKRTDTVSAYVNDDEGFNVNFKGSGMVLGYGCGTPGMTKRSRYPQEAYLSGRSV